MASTLHCLLKLAWFFVPERILNEDVYEILKE
jgi:hypothetical protein